MFTLNLKEVAVDPQINEEKVFQNEDRDQVLDDTENYINQQYPGKYNPYTLKRKISEAVKNASGENYSQEVESKFNKAKESDTSEDEKWQKITSVKEEAEKEYTEETDKVLAERAKAMEQVTTEEERQKVDEGYQGKIDEWAWKRDQKIDAAYKELDSE